MKAMLRYTLYLFFFVGAITFWVAFVEYIDWYVATVQVEPMSSVQDYILLVLYLLAVPLTTLAFVLFRHAVRRVLVS